MFFAEVFGVIGIIVGVFYLLLGEDGFGNPIFLTDSGLVAYWLRSVPVAFAIAAVLVITFLFVANRLERKMREMKVRKARLRLGSDGLELDGEFLAWRDFRECRATSDALEVESEGGRVLKAARPKSKDNIESEVQRFYDEYRRAEEPPKLSKPELIRLAEQDGGYRASNRGVLVRIATSPKSDLESRVQAAELLSEDRGASAEVETSLEHMLDRVAKEQIDSSLRTDSLK